MSMYFISNRPTRQSYMYCTDQPGIIPLCYVCCIWFMNSQYYVQPSVARGFSMLRVYDLPVRSGHLTEGIKFHNVPYIEQDSCPSHWRQLTRVERHNDGNISGPIQLRYHHTNIRNHIMEIRWSYDRLIFIMWFPILVRWRLYIGSGS